MAALGFHRKDMAIFEDLMRQDPAGGRRNAALAEKKVGALLEKLGDLPAAAELYRKAILLDRERSDSNPLDALARLDLSFSYGSLGNCLGQTGDFAGALENYGRALAIRRDLAAADPKNQRFHNAVVAHAKVGFYKARTGDLAGARESYGEAAAIHEAISRADPSNRMPARPWPSCSLARRGRRAGPGRASGTAADSPAGSLEAGARVLPAEPDLWLDLRNEAR